MSYLHSSLRGNQAEDHEGNANEKLTRSVIDTLSSGRIQCAVIPLAPHEVEAGFPTQRAFRCVGFAVVPDASTEVRSTTKLPPSTNSHSDHYHTDL